MIEVRDLSKNFKVFKKAPGLVGSLKSVVWRDWQVKAALKNINLRIAPGEIVGLLGANGAGKTTLVKSLSGIIYPTSGSIKVLDFNPWERKNAFRRQIALLMGQKAQLWWDLPAADCFLLLKEIYRIPEKRFQDNLAYLAEVLNVRSLLTTQIRRLSLGERMKMEVIAALLHDPKVVFLDEPTIGLDLSSQRALRSFLLEYHAKHKPTLIVTSHYMEDIQALCERIVIIREGEAIYDGKLDLLVNRYVKHKTITVQLLQPSEGHAHLELKSLKDLGGKFNDDAGEVLLSNAFELKLNVLRELVPQAASALLKKFPVADLNIEEIDVGSVIEAIQREGAH